MSDNDLLSHRLLERQIEREDVNYSLKNYEMPVNQQNGVHTRLADLPLQHALRFRASIIQDYISRLHQIPRVLDQVTEVMRQGMKDGLMPPKLVLEKLPGAMRWHHRREPFPSCRPKNFRPTFRTRTRSG